ncbi:TPA: hypothetical protein N0F65_002740 [Lagenidium giganteum]|uniref:ubiquitinyl hydrolase 1 n=1 Tax=Lagenidium giganteum TaxID=4803 RepID=A0AAV2Z411_9STRA|nr:TPA: hypothetical protein N0F65_002740 [Lagenidium giganteum]
MVEKRRSPEAELELAPAAAAPEKKLRTTDVAEPSDGHGADEPLHANGAMAAAEKDVDMGAADDGQLQPELEAEQVIPSDSTDEDGGDGGDGDGIDDLNVDAPAIASTPPPLAPHAFRELESEKIDPMGMLKATQLHRAVPGAPPMETIESPRAVEATSVLVFRSHFPVLTDQNVMHSVCQKDESGQLWRVAWYPFGYLASDDMVSVDVQLADEDQSAGVTEDVQGPPQLVNENSSSLASGGVCTPVQVDVILHHQGGDEKKSFRASVKTASQVGMLKLIMRGHLLNPELQLLTADGQVDVEVRLHLGMITSLVSTPETGAPGMAQTPTLNTLPSASDLMQYDSKKETGMVGLKNQGATCYMNSLLQTLFHLRAFRQVVYDTPTEKEDTNDSVTLALQRVFYRLQRQSKAVSTKELTRSFGWSQIDAFMQHDVQELYRILCDRVEEKMKHTTVDGTIKKLFEGKVRSFVQCVNVDFQSFRDESFYDLQLDVKGCEDIYESFRKYVEIEMLQGDNQYDAEGYGKQDAKKGVRFMKFPPVLNIQLKRFEYDPMRDGMVKIHDRFEFPKTLVLDEFFTPDDAKDTTDKDKKEAFVYHLHSVLVHSGDVHGGHYYVYIRPGRNMAQSTDWFKFDDDQITCVDEQAAIEGNYGSSPAGYASNSLGSPEKDDASAVGNGTGVDFAHVSSTPDDEHVSDVYEYNRGVGNSNLMMPMGRSYSSAYMLVYVRDGNNDISSIQDNAEPNGNSEVTTRDEDSNGADIVNNVDIPDSLLQRFHEEEKATARRKKLQQTEHLFMNLRIASDSSISRLKKITKTMDFSSFTNNTCLRIRIRRAASIRSLYERIYKRCGVPVNRQRLWKVITRENRTIRPDQSLENEHLDCRVDALMDEEASSKTPVRLYLQILDEPEVFRNSVGKSVINRHYLSAFVAPEEEESPEQENELKDEEDEQLDDPVAAVEEPKLVVDVPPTSPNEILLFIKFYDVKKKLGERLEYMGNILIDMRKTGADLAKYLHEALNIPFTTELILFEEIQPVSISEIEMEVTLESAEIQNGDIVCYQYAEDEAKLQMESETELVSKRGSTRERYPDVPSYFQYLLDRVDVNFQMIGKPEETFILGLLYSNVYDEIIDALADKLNMKDKKLHLRLYQHSSVTSAPKKNPLRHSKYSGDDQTTLEEFLTEYAERTNILHYEILANPITEIESKKQVLVYFSIYDECFVDPAAPKNSRRVEFLVQPNYTVKDLCALVKQLFAIPAGAQLRVCEVSHCGTFLHDVLEDNVLLERYWASPSGHVSMNDVNLFVELVPPEELAIIAGTALAGPSDDEGAQSAHDAVRLNVIHFNFQSAGQSWIHPHGVPLITHCFEQDTVAQLKERIRQRMGVSEEVFSRWNLSFVRDTRASPMKEVYEDLDEDAVDNLTMLRLEEVCGTRFSSITCMGLEHADTKPNTPKYARRQEQGIRIRQN